MAKKKTEAEQLDNMAEIKTAQTLKEMEQPISDPVETVEPPKKTVEDVATEAATTGKSFLQLYQENFPKPEYNQEKATNVQKAKNLSILADIIKTVGEGVTTNKGGQPIQRQSAAPVLNAELTRLNELYKQEMKAYKQGGFNALLMDEQQKQANQRQEAISKAQALKDAENLRKWEKEFALKNENATKQEAYRQAQLKLEEQRNIISASKKSGSTKESETKTVDLVTSDNQLATVAKSEVEAWKDKVSKMAISDPNISDEDKKNLKAYPQNAFSLHWDKYLTIQNGHLVPKQAQAQQQSTERKVAAKDIDLSKYEKGTDGKYRLKPAQAKVPQTYSYVPQTEEQSR